MAQFLLRGLVLLLAGLGAAGQQTFTDPAGDAGSAPDVTRVSVSSSDSGLLRFDITVSNATAWTNAGASLMVDADANYATGHDDGVDFLFTLHRDHTFDAGRWNGRDNFDPYGSAATEALAGDTLTISLPARELGTAPKLAFAVLTFDSGASSDQAPDGSFAPGTPPRWQFNPKIAARVTSIRASFAPAAPVHGARFGVRAVTARLSTGSSKRVARACVAKLGHSRLAGRCSWRIPARARGKRLAVTVRAGGLSRTYAFRVR